MEPIVNRVAESDIEVFNLEEFWDGKEVVEFDLEPFLYKGLVLREVEFREQVKQHEWEQYRDKHVAIFCSADAIVPTWAYMLVASKLHGIAESTAFGSKDDLIRDHFVRGLERADWERYRDRIVVVKGCGSRIVPVDAYVIATTRLQEVVRKLMFGEPCSSVPLWRRKAASTGAARSVARPAIPPRLPVSAGNEDAG